MFHKRWGISLLDERLLASQGLSSMELISSMVSYSNYEEIISHTDVSFEAFMAVMI